MVGFIIAGGILVAVGVVFLIVAIILLINKSNKKKYSAKTTGKVINMCKSAQSFNAGNDGEGAHFGVYVTGSTARRKHNRCPIFTYNVNGMQYTRADSIACDIDMINHMMQKQVDVYYAPHNPIDSKLTVRNPLMIIGLVFVFISMLLIGMGIVFLMSC